MKKVKGNSKNSKYIYNGIDRIDNSKGYTKENSITACKQCNISKSTYSQQDFINWINNCYNNLKGKNIL